MGVTVAYNSVRQGHFFRQHGLPEGARIRVSSGTISGPVPPFDTAMLVAKGSLYLTLPSIADYTADRRELQAGAAAVFDVVKKGVLRKPDPTIYSLRDAPQAHRDLEAGERLAGSIILTP